MVIDDDSKSILVTWRCRGNEVLFITTQSCLNSLYHQVAYVRQSSMMGDYTLLLLPQDFTVHDVSFSTIDDLRKSIGEDICGESPFNFIEEIDDDFV